MYWFRLGAHNIQAQEHQGGYNIPSVQLHFVFLSKITTEFWRQWCRKLHNELPVRIFRIILLSDWQFETGKKCSNVTLVFFFFFWPSNRLLFFCHLPSLKVIVSEIWIWRSLTEAFIRLSFSSVVAAVRQFSLSVASKAYASQKFLQKYENRMKIYRVLLKCVQFVCFGGEVIMKYETICILKSSTFCSFLCFLIRAKNFLFNLSGVSVYALQKFSIIVS